MDHFPIIIHTGDKGIDRKTRSQIKAHAMVTHLRQKAKSQEAKRNCLAKAAAPLPPLVEHVIPFRTIQFNPKQTKKATRDSSTSRPKQRRSKKSPSLAESTDAEEAASKPNSNKQPSCSPSPPSSFADITQFCGSYPFDGMAPEMSQQIGNAFQSHMNCHGIDTTSIQFPIHPIFTGYMARHFFTSKAAFFAVSLKALLFHAVENGKPENNWITQRNLYFLRGKALQEINKEILSSDAVQDSTITATVCLEMFENAIGSSQGPVHLRGLNQMLRRRVPESPTFSPATACLDAIDAILRDCPRLLTNDAPVPYLREEYLVPSTAAAPSPLWRNSPMRVVSLDPFAPDTISEDLSQLLFDAFSLVELFQTEVEMSDGSASPIDHDVITMAKDEIYGRLRAFPFSELNTKQGRVTEACRVAAWIHWRAVAGRIPHRLDPSNEIDGAYLWQILRETQLVDWVAMPYVYLWVLITGAASLRPNVEIDDCPSLSGTKTSFYYSRLCQFMLTLGLRWWDDFGRLLNNFCWLQTELRQQLNEYPGW